MTHPMIGITPSRVDPRTLGDVPKGMVDGHWEAVFVDYGRSVSDAGGVPVLVAQSAHVPALVSRLDGLILSGGRDVAPHLYGAESGPRATNHDVDRDEFEIQIISQALASGLPILAICRGMQILNVALGGTLVEHLEELDGFSHADTDEHRSALRHPVFVEPESQLAEAVAGELATDGSIRVNSFHHQAVLAPGRGLHVVAKAPDGTIEAVEMQGRPVLGVQWHPEMHHGTDPIFHWFIDAARHRERAIS